MDDCGVGVMKNPRWLGVCEEVCGEMMMRRREEII